MSYFMGFVGAVPIENRAAFVTHAEAAWEKLFKPLGALSVTETWGDDVPDGEVTSFPMAVKCAPGEAVVLSWIEWPDKETYQAAHERMMSPEFAEAMGAMGDMPFDGQRAIFGGFVPVLARRA